MKQRTVIRHSVSVFALVLGATTAEAQTAPMAAAEADDANAIVVTARRVNERLQDIPINVSVLTGQQLKRQGIDDLMDVAERTVGFAFEAISPLVVQPAIRGQTNLRTVSPVQNVPINVDGVYLQRGYMVDNSLLELQQIEIIKGPQSALYGRNAFAGVVNLSTRAPDLEKLEAEVSSTVGNADRFDVRGFVSIPLIKGKLAILGAIAHSQFDGTWANGHPLANDPQAFTRGNVGGWNKESYQVRMIAKPTDSLTLDAMYIRTEREIEQVPGYSFGTSGLASPFNTNNASLIRGAFDGTQNRLFVGKVPTLPVLAPGEIRSPGVITDPRAIGLRGPTDVVSAKLEWAPEGDWTAMYQLGFTRAAVNARGNPLRDSTVPLAPNPFLGIPVGSSLTLFDSSGNDSSFRGWSHEVQFRYDDGGPLRTIVGVNYSKTSDIESNGSELAPANSLVQPNPSFFFPIGPGLPFGLNALQRGTFLKRDENIYSGYAFFGYEPNEKLEITLEGRYTIEDQENLDLLTVEPGTGVPPGNPANPRLQARVPPRQAQTQSFFTPRASITYKATPDNMVYASAARGVKSGGFNGFVPFLPQRDYQPETNWTYEIGSKNQFLDGKLTVNLAAYYTVWRNLQTNGVRLRADGTSAPPPATAFSVIENIGGVNIWGGEIEMAYRATDWMTFDFAAAYTRSRYTQGTSSQRFGTAGVCGANVISNRVCTTIPDAVFGEVLPIGGNQVERIPAFDAVGGVSFNGALGSGDNNWFGRLEGTYQTKQFIDEANLAFVPGRFIVNANLGAEFGRFSINLWAKNIANKKYASSSLFLIGTGGALSTSYVPTLGEQRTFGLTGAVRF